MPKLTIDFYSVLDQEGQAVDITAELLQVSDRPLDRRLVEHGPLHSDVFLGTATVSGVVLVHLARIRKHGIPGKFNRDSGDFGDLPLDANEDIAEDLYVAYDAELETIAIPRNGQFRASSVEHLFSDLLAFPILLEPKLRPDAIAKLARMERLGSMRIKMNAAMNDPALTGQLHSLGEVINQVNQHANLASFDLTLQMNRGRSTAQDAGFFRQLLTRIAGSGNVRNLQARVLLAGDEKTEVIDFLRDRLVHSGEVNALGKRLDGDQCKQLLRAAIQQHRNFLTRLKQNPPSAL